VLCELSGPPVVEDFHARRTLLLIQEQTLWRRKIFPFRLLVGAQDLAQGPEDEGDFVGKGLGDLDVLASRMRDAGGGLDRMIARLVAGEAIVQMSTARARKRSG
jgi:hypothetical protein